MTEEQKRQYQEIEKWIIEMGEFYGLSWYNAVYLTNTILSNPHIVIVDEDQSLPDYDSYYGNVGRDTPRYDFARRSCWSKGQRQMLQAGFRKIVTQQSGGE